MFSPTSILTFLVLGIVFGFAFFVLGYVFRKKTAERKIRSAEIRWFVAAACNGADQSDYRGPISPAHQRSSSLERR